MKKLFALLMVVCLICGCFFGCAPEEEEPTLPPEETPVATPAETPLPQKELEYDHTKFVLDGVVLKAYIGNETEVTIPEEVIIIDKNAFKDCKTVEKINFVDTIQEIRDYAFFGCTALKEVNVPKKVKSVGDFAFANCTALEKATTPTLAWDLGKGLYQGDTALKEITFSSSLSVLPSYFAYGCSSLESIKLTAVIEIGDYAFFGCEKLAKVEGASVASIGDAAFMNCSALESGTFSKAVTSIGSKAFEGTKWLEEAKTASKTPKKPDDAFVIIGKGVLVYCSGAVPEGKDANDPTTIPFVSAAKCIGPEAYKDFAETCETIEFPTSVTKIEKGAFESFKKLVKITLSNSIVDIPEAAFANCENLEDATILGKVTSIGASAFEGCVKLVNISTSSPKKAGKEAAEEAPTDDKKVVNIPAAVVTIGDNAFANCVSVTAVVIPDKETTTVGDKAFFGCEKLADVTVGNAVAHIGVSAFGGTPWFENWAGDENVKQLIVGDGVLIKDVSNEYNTSAKEIKSVSIALDGLTALNEKQFYGNTKLCTVIIPEGVKEISDYAFYYAENLEQVILPSTLEKIGANAFYGCKNLVNVDIKEGVKEIDDYAFYGCAKLAAIKLPASLTKIGKFAFYNCIELGEANVSANVKTIGEYAFSNTKWVSYNTEKFLIAGDGILIAYYAFEDETVVTAGDGIKAICGGAFEGSYRLKKLTLPANFTKIDAYAFSGLTTIESIVAPGVTFVGERAFNYCRNLKEATFGAATIANNAFEGCESYNR